MPNTPIDINVLSSFLSGISSFHEELVQNFRRNETLCHYTSLEGALGIISGSDLWLTNARFSNDDEEMNYGQNLVVTLLDEMKREAVADPSKLGFLEGIRKGMEESKREQVYICCFCEKDNLLSQWRGYAENGGGISIEFNGGDFADITGRDSLHGLMRLWKVFYREEQQRDIVRRCIDHLWPAVGDARVPYVVNALQFFMPTFKNADFQEERERRLIFTPNQMGAPKLKFRTRRGMLVPYFSLRELAASGAAEAFKLPIKGVLIGPGPYRALNSESAEMALKAYDYPDDIKVRASSTAFRG